MSEHEFGFPPLSIDLIDELDRLYPALSPREIYRLDREEQLVRAAQRELVEALLNKRNNALEVMAHVSPEST